MPAAAVEAGVEAIGTKGKDQQLHLISPDSADQDGQIEISLEATTLTDQEADQEEDQDQGPEPAQDQELAQDHEPALDLATPQDQDQEVTQAKDRANPLDFKTDGTAAGEYPR